MSFCVKPKINEYRVGRFWFFCAWVNVILSVVLFFDFFAGEHPTQVSKVISCVSAFVLLCFGAGLMWICCYYIICIKDYEIICKVFPFSPKKYTLRGVQDVRINGVYLTIDYGRVPKEVILLLNRNRIALFYRIAEIAHELPSGALSILRSPTRPEKR